MQKSTIKISRQHKASFQNALNFPKQETQTQKDKFNEWLLKIGNVHTANNEKMSKAFDRIIEF